jgi:hypothetical protein
MSTWPANALRDPRAPLVALVVAILASIWLVFRVTSGQSFAVDELFYYGRVATKDNGLIHFTGPFTPHYLLAPFNGHLALGGRLVYETVFATIGAKYKAFVLIDALGIVAAATLVFVLARRRIGDLAALAPVVVLLFLGFAREQFAWPIDFNSAWSLAFGLGAVLCLQRRRSWREDLAACLLLAISASLIEVGLAFCAGVAVMVLAGPAPRWRRAWIFLLPIALYGAWYLWAIPIYGSSEGAHLANLGQIPKTYWKGIAGTLGALSGTNEVTSYQAGNHLTWFGKGLALAAIVAFALRLRRGRLPATTWVWLATLAVYWTLLALAIRAPESYRYLLVSGSLLVLIAADTVRRPLSSQVAAVLLVIAAVAIPANVAELFKERQDDTFHVDAKTSRIDFGALQIARGHVDPGYVVSADPRVAEAGGGMLLGLPAGVYLEAAEQNGPLGYSLDQIRSLPEESRATADAAVAGALALQPEPVAAPGNGAQCRSHAPEGGETVATLPFGRSLVHLDTGQPTPLGLRRFAGEGEGFALGELHAGGWVGLTIPRDGAPEPWRAVVAGPLTVCTA